MCVVIIWPFFRPSGICRKGAGRVPEGMPEGRKAIAGRSEDCRKGAGRQLPEGNSGIAGRVSGNAGRVPAFFLPFLPAFRHPSCTLPAMPVGIVICGVRIHYSSVCAINYLLNMSDTVCEVLN